MVNDEKFDEEAYLKSLESEQPVSDELIQNFHNMTNDLKKLNEHFERDLLSENDKKIGKIVEDIERKNELETKYIETLSENEKTFERK